VIEELQLPARGPARWAVEPCSASVWRLQCDK
jgi:hypothetical protein